MVADAEKIFTTFSQSSSPGSFPGPGNFELTLDQKYAILERCGHKGLEDLDDLPLDGQFMIEKIEKMTVSKSIDILKEAIEYHKNDVNYPQEDYEKIIKLVAMSPPPGTTSNENLVGENEKEQIQIVVGQKGDEEPVIDASTIFEVGEINLDWQLSVRLEAALIYYHSPYPEVRAVTDPFDDPTIPVETIRSYVLAIIWIVVGSGVNEFFYHRKPSISLSTAVIQLLLYPCGKCWEYVVPDWGVNIRGTRVSLNPGPWNFKEQMFASIIYSVSSVTAYVDSNIVVQKLQRFYGNDWASFGYQALLIISTQCMGFGFAGLLRKFSIYPVRSVWPTILPTLALNRALLKPEKKENINGWTITRYKLFFFVTTCSFIYFWLPDYLFQALSTFNWLTWIKPDNFNLAVITGTNIGMGINPIPTFDWNVLNYNYAMTIPFYSQLNQYVGTFIGTLAVIGVYYTNYKWTAYLPPNDESVFTNTGEYYEVTNILTNNLIDRKKYEEYGPPFYSAGNMVTYGAYFAIYPFSFVYTFYNEWNSIKISMKDVYRSVKNYRRSNFESFKDPHSKMMSKYREVPDWWFFIILIIAVVFLIACCEHYPTNTPVWAIFFDLAINYIFLIPLTTLLSVTGYTLGLNVLVELIIGYALPGNGVALMILKALGYNIDGQAQTYVHDQKLAHYAKIPPLAVFRGQLVSTIINCFITLAVINWEISNVQDFCSPTQSQKFSCPQDTIFYSASVIWGVIGPKKVFEGLYPIFKWCFLIGALLTIPCILFHRYGPTKFVKYFQPTLIIGGMLNFAPYNLSYYTGGLYLSFIFMFFIKRRYLTWWEKYNYVLTAALNAGIAFSAVIIFFSVQLKAKPVHWWGNDVIARGVENSEGRISLLDISSLPGGYFGPRKGHFP